MAFNALAATFIVVNSNDSGAGSLRQAIFDANDTPGQDLVLFDIFPGGPQTIELVADGVSITDPVTIDGSSQPGFVNEPLVALAGTEDAGFGFRIATSNCTIRSLVISNFTGSGILIEANASGNLIGGTNRGAGNAIVSNLGSGVAVVSGTNNAIRGNSIFGNGVLGIDLQEDGLTLNDDQDTDSGPNELQNFPVLASATISGDGVAIVGSLNSRPNTIFQIDLFANQACDDSGHGEGEAYLGTRLVTTAVDGTVAFNLTLPTAFGGRFISATATDPFGNTSEFSACVFAVGALEPLTFTVVNTEDAGPGSLRQAILDANAWVSLGTNRIHFNIPGTEVHTVAPISALPAILGSVLIDGYTQPGARLNTLSNGFNARLLIRLDGAKSGVGSVGLSFLGDNSTVRGLAVIGFAGSGIQVAGARTNVIEGNLIGLDLDGTAFGNGQPQGDDLAYPGVLLINSAGSTVGGLDVAARNVICANGAEGIHISGADSTGNRMLGNFIGIDATGMVGLGNESWGVRIEGANNVLGGIAVGAGNLISWNSDGVLISAGVSNQVQGNFIGSDVSGTNALGNGSGILIVDSAYTLVGGTSPAARNVIVANGRGGVEIVATTIGGNNVVQGNSIGTDATGQLAMGNGSFGVRFATTDGNLLGGTSSGAGNIIAFNGGNGVEIAGGVNNAILRNSIFNNDALGIDLEVDGLTANDAGDSDAGANQRQNFPVLASAAILDNRTVIQGSLDSLPGRAFRIQLFVNDECDDSNYGEGQAYLADIDVVTDPGGHANFSYSSDTPLAVGRFISATATDPDENTSEFSPCVKGVMIPSAQPTLSFRSGIDGCVIEWPPGTPQSFVLETTTSLTPPILWTGIPNAVSPFEVGNKLDNATRFYRLRMP